MQLEGKRVLITGASSGIGRALTWEFARSGAVLALAARNESALQKVSCEIGLAFPLLPVPLVTCCDVADSASVRISVEACRDALGGIDVLVNNAGICVYGDSARTPMKDIREVMEVNFFGAIHCIFECMSLMKAAGFGLIVNITSVAAIHGIPYLGAYGASKAALAAIGQSLRAELKGSGISVMNVYPNYTRTALFEHEKNVGGAHRPQPPYADPAEVAGKIVRAIKQNRRDLILSGQGKALFMFQGLVPSLVEKKMKQIADRLRDIQERSHA
jgi:short-subunit dehydrogenase